MSQTKPFKAAIVGANGYVGSSLARLLLAHPFVELTHISSRSRDTQPLTDAAPHLTSLTNLTFTNLDALTLAQKHTPDVLFLALPHGASMQAVETLFDTSGKPLTSSKIIDMSGDYRLSQPEPYEAFYNTKHTSPNLLSSFVYGLPEWKGSQIRDAHAVANPGCFATAISLALAPLAHTKLLPKHTTIFAATGSTGSGATPKATTHHPERAANFKLYKVLTHQHTPEILSLLHSLGAPNDTHISFIPASAPMTHGIYATLHMLHDNPQAAVAAIEEAYAHAPFVRVRPSVPHLNWVTGSNFADISCTAKDNELVVVCAIDNMIKGAAGQAIQNMNLMLGLDSTEGLQTLLPSFP